MYHYCSFDAQRHNSVQNILILLLITIYFHLYTHKVGSVHLTYAETVYSLEKYLSATAIAVRSIAFWSPPVRCSAESLSIYHNIKPTSQSNDLGERQSSSTTPFLTSLLTKAEMLEPAWSLIMGWLVFLHSWMCRRIASKAAAPAICCSDTSFAFSLYKRRWESAKADSRISASSRAFLSRFQPQEWRSTVRQV